ncbi:hypothetical protein, partial [Desulfonatronospira sp.]|uniref:hypothetical protein n=1 Tax=Desulfonatronospira sp. TaxID=1962951 RepID=UPI0025C125F8
MSKNKDKCIIITGMHHSGTDILAGCLQLSGVKTVGDYTPLDPQTGQTSQELQDISLVHDLLMQDLDVSW